MSTVGDPIEAFAAEVGPVGDGGVAISGGSTHGDIGGAINPAVRRVRAPAGIVWIAPEDMTVCCYAATPVGELQAALAPHGQLVSLPDDHLEATVGGVLAVGRSGVDRLGRGPVRDTLLQARYVSADGVVVKAGGPTVKNVTGFDLCRLLVGSLGTLGFIGEVILRTRPRPRDRRWFRTGIDPFELATKLYRPTAILWDGETTAVCLEGHPDDLDDVARRYTLAALEGPPVVPTGSRRSVAPGELRSVLSGRPAGSFLAEIGVGVVHLHASDGFGVVGQRTSERVLALNETVKRRFDPTGRLNPGRTVVAS